MARADLLCMAKVQAEVIVQWAEVQVEAEVQAEVQAKVKV
jgi:hypothetical protein